MIVFPITELIIVGVHDRGIPNIERIVLRANQDINLGQYGIMLGVKQPMQNSAYPINDNLFWLGEAKIQFNDWIFIYTGPGFPRTERTIDGLNNIHIGHWGKQSTVMANPEIVPILFRVEAVQLPFQPINLPQNNQLT